MPKLVKIAIFQRQAAILNFFKIQKQRASTQTGTLWFPKVSLRSNEPSLSSEGGRTDERTDGRTDGIPISPFGSYRTNGG